MNSPKTGRVIIEEEKHVMTDTFLSYGLHLY
jgi:hypothetical protein